MRGARARVPRAIRRAVLPRPDVTFPKLPIAALILGIGMASASANAAWVKFAENDRLVAYYEPTVKSSGLVTVWVMFDYKSQQESARSGRRYLSQKGQQEVDCVAQRTRTVFFTWLAGRMGDGVVVYTGRTPTPWEPNSPGGIGRALASEACVQR